MRIDGWQVDGFGILKDHARADLEPGVTVLLGENEAGKSTLLAFVRAILFGFPAGNSREPRYPPVVGGRHGGRLMLRDQRDGLWVIERYAEKKKVIGVTRPDGRPGDESDLRVLLGGADAGLFRSVFAFSLDELRSFDALSESGVRDRIFSAGISGAGRSAREVMRRLEQRMGGLLKQGVGQARINDLVRDVLKVDEAEQVAAGVVSQYETLLEEEREQTRLAEEILAKSRTLQQRKRRAEALIELRPGWEALAALRLELTELPAVTDEALPQRVAGLTQELSSQRGREERLPELEQGRAVESDALKATLSHLGPEWDIERVKTFATSIAVVDDVRSWEGKLQRTDGAAGEAERAQVAAEEAVTGLGAEKTRVLGELPETEPLSVDEIDERELQLRRLREDVNQLRLIELQTPHAEQAAPSRSLLLYVLTGLAGLGAIGSLIAGYDQLAIGLGVAVLLLLVASVSLAARRGAAPASGDAAQRRGPGVIERMQAGIAETAQALGMPPAPSTSDMGTCEADLNAQRSRRSAWDAVQRRVSELNEKLDAARRVAHAAATAAETAASDRTAATQGWQVWLSGRSLPALSPAGVRDLLAELESARAADARLQSAITSIERIRDLAKTWSDSATEVLQAAGKECAGLPEDTLRMAVEALDGELRRRARVVEQIAGLERTISVRLVSADDPDEAMDELADGDVSLWSGEVERLDEELAGLQEERDTAIKAATAARTESEQIEESADIPRLQEQRESLRAQLAELVHEYRVVTTARALIGDTLKSYVRERQPAVLAGGSEAFSTVTNGRYVKVEQDDAGGLESVVVVNRDGRRLTPEQLSTGTQQQLYLAIRLALVADLAKRTEPLPLIMDDCLVNFDPNRAAAVAGLLAERSADGQCLLFTCHPETAELVAAQRGGPVRVIQMAPAGAR